MVVPAGFAGRAAGPTPEHIGIGDVQRVEAMTDALARQDLAFGGGACREAIVVTSTGPPACATPP